MKRRVALFALLMIPAAALIALAFQFNWFGTSNIRPDSAADESLDIELPLVNRNPGYVGAQVCGECHAARLAEFKETRHYKALWQPEPGPMPRGFAEPSTVSTEPLENARFEVFRSGNEYRQRIVRDASHPQPAAEHKIDLIYGSAGQGDEVYFSWIGNALFELPVSWLGPQQQWGIQAWADPNLPGDFKRTATTRCIECHTTWFEHHRGTENVYTRDKMLFGVTCERCHGPGQQHVEYHRSHPQATRAQGLVNPENLSRDQQIDICGQCHTNAPYRKTAPFSFRPGDKLEDHFRVMVGKGLEHDHVADQMKYLMESKCYQQSDTLSCTTCHNPHRKSDPLQSGDQSCIACHQPQQCTAHASTPEPLRSGCVACHMPRYTRVAVKFHTNDDRYVFPMRPRQHRIGVYPAAQQEVLLDWYRTQTDEHSQAEAVRLTEVLQKYWLDESESLQQQYLFVAAIGAVRESLRIARSPAAADQLAELIGIQTELEANLSNAQRLMGEGRFERAAEMLDQVLKLKPDQAVAHSRLGTIYAIAKQPERSRYHLEKVRQCDPDNALGENMLGWLAYLSGDGQQALQAFERADEIYPYTSETNFRWALALLQLQRWSEAEQKFMKVLEIDPNHIGGCQGMSNTLVELKNPRDAVRYGWRAARLSSYQNADVLLSLANAYAADGRRKDALAIAEQALDLAMQNSTELVPVIREKLQEFEAPSE